MPKQKPVIIALTNGQFWQCGMQVRDPANATLYPSAEEAEKVMAFKNLDGEIIDPRDAVQAQQYQRPRNTDTRYPQQQAPMRQQETMPRASTHAVPDTVRRY